MKRFLQFALASLLLTASVGITHAASACDPGLPSDIPSSVADVGTSAMGSAKVVLKNPGPDSYLNVRTSPSTQSAALGRLRHGTRVNTLRQHGNWYLVGTIEEDRLVGWVDGAFLGDFGELIN